MATDNDHRAALGVAFSLLNTGGIRIHGTDSPVIDLPPAAVDELRRLLRPPGDVRLEAIDDELPRLWGEPEHYEEAQTVALVHIARALELLATR